MPPEQRHQLEIEYGLSANELLDALAKRFRAKVTLEGAVAEVQMEKHLSALVGDVVERYETHDEDGRPDFSLWLTGSSDPLRAECKNVRNSNAGFRLKGEIVAYKVETQKTRASQADATSRHYGFDQFEILGVCLGKKTGNWTQFLYAWTSDLTPHKTHRGKLAAIQRVPLPDSSDLGVWSPTLRDLLDRHA